MDISASLLELYKQKELNIEKNRVYGIITIMFKNNILEGDLNEV